ncbi:polysaccharide biosynthesis protein [Gordonia crocea]|uniref:Polysaccharide biosynthesis protein n=1 Tax=Gordonia crocea TaxID=589162 RepID=A0A7I9V0P4_9ACTN|nr:polysaccharide biosynthesis protein [Gordonia crocea]GED96053.1 polysaccharide biosynthesis protein [Gordonia crocea]GED98955.1 polysaccharide biosynthesis protein [Gordonia crocea]
MTVGAMVANIAAYLVALPASRALGAVDYGVFGVVMAAMVIAAAPSMAVQAVIAREVVRGRPGLTTLGLRAAALVAMFSLVAGVVLVPLTRIPMSAAAAGLVMAPLITVTAAAQGFLQGRGQFHRLGWLLGLVGLLRSGPIIVALGLGAAATGALWAGALGTLAAAGVAWSLLRISPSDTAKGSVPPDAHQGNTFSSGAGVGSVLAASQVQLALLVAVSLDLLLARVVLSATDAGVYALGAVATKAAFWLPQAIGTVVYPRLAAPERDSRSLRMALGVVAGIGAVTVVGTWVLSPLVPRIVGEEYRPLTGILWLFAATGAVLSLLALLLLAVIAVRRTTIGLAVWACTALEAVAILGWADSVTSLVAIAATAATVMTALCLVAVISAERSSRRA